MKKTTKKTKKVVKPEILINTVDCETVNDIYTNYIEAKVNAKRVITKEELDLVKNNTCNATLVFLGCECEVKAEKKPWYKRFWKWLRRK